MKQMIHYINNGRSGIYGKDVFIKEASAIGVNRAFAGFIAKKVNFGDKIYTAIYEKDRKAPNAERWLNGTANVFGYFVVDSINFIGDMSPVYKALNIKNISVSAPTKIQRSCGSYVVHSAIALDKNQQLKDIIEEADKQKIKYKLFLGGKFYPYEVQVFSVNFSRSIVWADFPEDNKQQIDEIINELRELTNYQRIGS